MLSSLKTNGLSPSEITFAQILANYPLPTVLFSKENQQIIAFNKPAADHFGYSPDELTGFDFLKLFPEQNRLELFHMLSCRKDKKFCLTSTQNKSGKLHLAEVHASVINTGDLSFHLATIVEMTSQTTIGAADEINKYKTYINNSTEGIFCQEFLHPLPLNMELDHLVELVKTSSYLSECNDVMAQMYGFEKGAEMKGVSVGELLDFSDPATTDFLKSFFVNGCRTVNAESHERDRNGQHKYFLNNAIGIIEDGCLKRIWGTQQDITDQKKTEEQLKLLASLVEQTSDILTAADINYVPVSWNSGAEKVYGITAEQAIGHDLRQYITIHYSGVNRDELRRIISESGEWRGEAHFVRPTDNKIVHLLMCFKAMFNDKGRHLGYLVSAVDVTERKEAERRLKESENRFREMADSSPVMIWMSDDQNKITYLNQKWIEFTGSDIIGKDGGSWSMLVHKDDLAKANAAYHKAFQARKEVTLIYRLLSVDGQYHWVHDVSVPRFLADGTFVGYIGSVVDIQDQKEKEKQLLYQAMILDNVSDVIVTTDLDFKVRSWNRIAEDYYDVLEKDAVGKKMSELADFTFYDTSLEAVVRQLREKDGWEGEAHFSRSNGEVKYFHYTLKGIYDEHRNKIGYLSTGRDITEKKMADEKMKKSEQFYRTLIADSLDGIILLDKEGIIKFSSPSVKNVLGYETTDIIGKSGFEFVHGEDLLWAAESFQKEVSENPEIKYIVIRLRKKTGEWIWCTVRGHNLLNNPYIHSIVVYFHDDTLRKQASDALKESEKKFRSLIRDLQVGVFLADKRGTIMMCNKALSLLLSLPEEEIVGRNVYEILDMDMINEKEELIPLEQRPLSTAIESKSTVKDFVLGVRHPLTSERCWIMMNADPIVDEKDEIKHIVCSVMDLTERKKLEKQLLEEQIGHQKEIAQATIDGQEAERREIGKELHDNIGQQLTTIKLFLDLAKSTADDAAQEMISMGLKGVSEVINEIRAMSRSLVPSTLQDLGLIESINELVDSIGRTQVISILLDSDGFPENKLPENQKLALYRIIQEQLNNIVKHANASQVSIVLREKKGRAVLEIRDDGCGFEPKKIRKGLGFMNIKNRAELLGGKNDIISQPGKGCVLRVSLPLPKVKEDAFVAIPNRD